MGKPLAEAIQINLRILLGGPRLVLRILRRSRTARRRLRPDQAPALGSARSEPSAPVLLTAFGFAVVVFIDVNVELGIAVATLYVAALLLAWTSKDERIVVATAATACLMVFLGGLLSPAGGEVWQVLINRGLSLLLVIVTTVFLVRDIWTSREAERRAAEIGHLASIVTFAEEAIFSGTLDGTILTWNRGAEALFGYGADEMIGDNVRRLIPGHLQSEFRLAIDRLEKGRALVGMEVRRVRKDDSLVDVAVTVSPIFGPDGRVTRLSSICRDLTAQRQVEQERNHLAALVNSSSEAIVSTDLQGVILSWNEGAEKLYGIPVDEALGRDLVMTVPPDFREEFREMYSKLRAGNDVPSFATIRIGASGQELAVGCHAHPVREQAGPTRSVAVVVHDRTEVENDRHSLERTLSTLSTRLKDRTTELVELQRSLRRVRAGKQRLTQGADRGRESELRPEHKLIDWKRQFASSLTTTADSIESLAEGLLKLPVAGKAVPLVLSLRRRTARLKELIGEQSPASGDESKEVNPARPDQATA